MPSFTLSRLESATSLPAAQIAVVHELSNAIGTAGPCKPRHRGGRGPSGEGNNLRRSAWRNLAPNHAAPGRAPTPLSWAGSVCSPLPSCGTKEKGAEPIWGRCHTIPLCPSLLTQMSRWRGSCWSGRISLTRQQIGGVPLPKRAAPNAPTGRRCPKASTVSLALTGGG